MYSEKARKNADACRYCWMCRHLCPVGIMTGKETNTPRAKGLLVSMTERNFPLDASSAEVMYECMLCGSCTNDCVTGFEPPLFIREARTDAVVNGLVPASVQKVIDRIEKTGNMFGLPAESKWDALKEETAGLPDRAEVLLYVGNTAAYRQPEIARAVMRLLKKAQVNFTVMKNEIGTGIELGDLIGFVEDVRIRAKACAQAVNASGARKVVVLDSYDAAFMKHEYADWGCGLQAEVVTATSFVADLLREGRFTVEKTARTVTYQDGSRLARDLDEHEPAREIIAATGAEIREMFLNRRMAKCGGSEIVKQYRPDIALLTAKGRWTDVLHTSVRTLVTACPQAYDVLADAVPEGCEILDAFMMLNESVK